VDGDKPNTQAAARAYDVKARALGRSGSFLNFPFSLKQPPQTVEHNSHKRGTESKVTKGAVPKPPS
jgi:hypothetical protein